MGAFFIKENDDGNLLMQHRASYAKMISTKYDDKFSEETINEYKSRELLSHQKYNESIGSVLSND